IGAGVRSEAKGMAPEAVLNAYEWNNDRAEMAQAGADGLLISNHSYGRIAGWHRADNGEWYWYGDVRIDERTDYSFGYYDDAARQWDMIANNAAQYLIVKAAGNDRNDNGPRGDDS